MTSDDGQYHFTDIFDELLPPTGSRLPNKNKLAVLLLLQRVVLADINANHPVLRKNIMPLTQLVLRKAVVSSEMCTVSRIY